jgi:drug/metabolite transporter (DMT)-like permease
LNIQLLGQTAALGTAFCWAITSTSFEAAGKRIGSFQVNLIRLFIAFTIFTIYATVVHGRPLPIGAGTHIWIWLTLSGLVGFVLGDLFLFQAFVDVGARTAMLIYSSVPPMTAILGWIILGERLTYGQIAGMVLTVVGIAIVVTVRKEIRGPDLAIPPVSQPDHKALRLAAYHRVRGMWFAVLGAFGQALGLVLSRYGAPTYDPFGATQIRALAGMLGFAVLFTVTRRWHRIGVAMRDRKAMTFVTSGAFFGPFLGVSLGLFAAQRAGTGIAATLIATVPVILIPVAIFKDHERVGLQEVIGVVTAVAGVAILFLV